MTLMTNEMPEKIEVKGRYIKTYYRNIKTGYTRFLFDAGKDGKLMCCGCLPQYAQRTPLSLIGHLERKPETDVSLFIVEASAFWSNHPGVLNEFLEHNLCHGVGKVTANAIREAFGEAFEEGIMSEEASDILRGIRGITGEKADIILSKIRSTLLVKKIYEELYPYGGDYQNAYQLFDRYYAESLTRVRKQPYQCGREVGLPFPVLDAYAKNHGFQYYEPQRIRQIAERTFFQIGLTGSTYLDAASVIRVARRIEVMEGAFEECVPEALLWYGLCQSPAGIVMTAEAEIQFYSKHLYQAEEYIADRLYEMEIRAVRKIPPKTIEAYIAQEKELDECQKETYHMLERTGVSILTGGPGTGKMTTVKKLITAYRTLFPDAVISLCASTGRAAERLMEATGYPATTIHMLLEYCSYTRQESRPGRNADNPLDCGLLIIDEFSMVDTMLFMALLKAVDIHTTMILVGDENQLKSVGPGKLLEDLIASGRFRTFVLDSVHRQAEGNSIICNSQKIIAADTALITDEHFHILRYDTEADAKFGFQQLMKTHYDIKNYMDVQTLSVSKQGVCGVYSLNAAAQQLFQEESQPSYSYGNERFYPNDKVMTISNNYEKGYMNGDIGILEEIQPNAAYIQFQDYKVEVPTDHMEDLALAYAMTVHKSQGSEANTIILLLSAEAPSVLLNNAVVYVGVTRAKESIYILSVRDALEKAILNRQKSRRKTGLQEKIKKRWKRDELKN